MKENIKVEIAKNSSTLNGFTVKEGYVLFKNNDKVVGVSSGWTDIDLMYIYTHQNGEWVGDWEDDENFPVEEAIEKLQSWIKKKEITELSLEVEKLLKDGEQLHISDKPIRFTDVVPGNKSSDGGEYGFYSTYYPTEVAGIYECYTSTTCEFDACGTGYEGLEILTQDKYQYLASKEEVE